MEEAKTTETITVTTLAGLWQDFPGQAAGRRCHGRWDRIRPAPGKLADALCSLPEDRKYFRKVMKLFKDRRP